MNLKISSKSHQLMFVSFPLQQEPFLLGGSGGQAKKKMGGAPLHEEITDQFHAVFEGAMKCCTFIWFQWKIIRGQMCISVCYSSERNPKSAAFTEKDNADLHNEYVANMELLGTATSLQHPFTFLPSNLEKLCMKHHAPQGALCGLMFSTLHSWDTMKFF